MKHKVCRDEVKLHLSLILDCLYQQYLQIATK